MGRKKKELRQLTELPLSAITLVRGMSAGSYGEERVAELARSLAGGGQHEPILVKRSAGDGRYGLLMSNGGKSNDNQVISADWVKAATTADREATDYGNLYEGYSFGYGYQWWLLPNGHFEAQGIYGQFVYVAPESDVVIVKLSFWPEPWVEEMEFEGYAFFDAVIEALN